MANTMITGGINLYSGNNPQWIEQHSSKLLEYINQELGWTNVRKNYY
ncbi:hypothetical protein GCM10020331_073840 [Ectobacillus funiculus]